MFFQRIDSEKEIFALIKAAESALLNRDFPNFIHLFREIWVDISEPPDFTDFPNQAELLSLAGEFLIHYSKSHNLVNFQSRGKDLLFRSIELFLQKSQSEKALRSQILLATSYFYEGGVEEYAAYLADAESKFQGDKEDSNFLRLQINLIIYDLETANLISAESRVLKNFKYFCDSKDASLKTRFFIEAGITFRKLRSYSEALEVFNRGLKIAEESKNKHHKTLIFNNLANTYRSRGEFERAHVFAEKALNLTKDQPGWKANLLDTKALIYFDQKEFEKAESTINSAISLFKQGEDYGGLCEALWNKSRILIQLDLRELAFTTFIECYQIAAERISGDESRRYLSKFTELMPVVSEGNIFEKMDSYKRHLIEKALLKANGKITEAAKILGIDHRTLSAMMKNFPSLYNDLGIKRRIRTSGK